MIETFLGSVNSWECDENDHLNVRFFSQKMYQTLVTGLLDVVEIKQTDLKQLMAKLSIEQKRFIAEARIAAPLSGYFAILSKPSEELKILTELRHSQTNQLMSAFIYCFDFILPDANITASAYIEELPKTVGYRGLTQGPLGHSESSIAEALSAGFQIVGKGLIQADECDQDGQLLHHLYMGRCSDSMPNLWAQFEQDNSQNNVQEKSLGGAVLEFEMCFFQQLNLGDRFVMLSGIHGLGNKTIHLVHQFYNVTSGKIVLSAQAISITMDLDARKAVEIPGARRALLSANLLS